MAVRVALTGSGNCRSRPHHGIAATTRMDAALAAEPDCIVYYANGDTRLPEAMADKHISRAWAVFCSAR
jgi:hypothetical protein